MSFPYSGHEFGMAYEYYDGQIVYPFGRPGSVYIDAIAFGGITRVFKSALTRREDYDLDVEKLKDYLKIKA